MQDSTKRNHTTNNGAAVEALGWSFEHLHGLVEAEVFQSLAGVLHGGEMTFSQMNALCRLYRNGPQTVTEIARGADLSHTAASRMVERLVLAGLVERREDPQDRRQKRIEITPEGTERLNELQSVTARTYAGVLANAPGEILERLGAVLAELRPHLQPHPLLRGGE